MMQRIYKVDGMSCGGCRAALEQAIKQVAPDESVSIDLDTGHVTVEQLDERQLSDIVDHCGFTFVGQVSA